MVDPGDFAVRGGIIDIFPPGSENPVRLDFFGDTLESIREFDAQTQRSNVTLRNLTLNLANEVLLSAEAIGRFRTGYAAAFGGLDLNDPLYESVTNGRRYQGMEHWLPLFHDHLETLLDYLPGSPISLDHAADESMLARQEQVAEFYDARREAREKGLPLPPSPEQRTAYISERNGNSLLPTVPALPSPPLKARTPPAFHLAASAAAASPPSAPKPAQASMTP